MMTPFERIRALDKRLSESIHKLETRTADLEKQARLCAAWSGDEPPRVMHFICGEWPESDGGTMPSYDPGDSGDGACVLRLGHGGTCLDRWRRDQLIVDATKADKAVCQGCGRLKAQLLGEGHHEGCILDAEPKGCPTDDDGDGNCATHPDGCPQPEGLAVEKVKCSAEGCTAGYTGSLVMPPRGWTRVVLSKPGEEPVLGLHCPEHRPRRPGHYYVLLKRGPGPDSDFIELEDHEGHGIEADWTREDSATSKPLWVLEVAVGSGLPTTSSGTAAIHLAISPTIRAGLCGGVSGASATRADEATCVDCLRERVADLEATLSRETEHFLNSDQEAFVLHLIDVVWGIAHDDESVPDWAWSSRMIAKAWESFDGKPPVWLRNLRAEKRNDVRPATVPQKGALHAMLREGVLKQDEDGPIDVEGATVGQASSWITLGNKRREAAAVMGFGKPAAPETIPGLLQSATITGLQARIAALEARPLMEAATLENQTAMDALTASDDFNAWWEAQGLRLGPGKSTAEAVWRASRKELLKTAPLGFEEWWGDEKRGDPMGIGKGIAAMAWVAGREALPKDGEQQPAGFACPKCSATHTRGWLPGSPGNYRCLKCGYTGPNSNPPTAPTLDHVRSHVRAAQPDDPLATDIVVLNEPGNTRPYRPLTDEEYAALVKANQEHAAELAARRAGPRIRDGHAEAWCPTCGEWCDYRMLGAGVVGNNPGPIAYCKTCDTMMPPAVAAHPGGQQ